MVLLLSVAVTLVATTQTGLHWAWSTARDYLPDNIEIASVEGQLIGPLKIRGLKMTTDSMRLRLSRFTLRWDALALLSGVVHIQKIGLEGLEYTALPKGDKDKAPPQKKQPFELPQAISLPVVVQLDALVLHDARIRMAPDAKPFVIDQAHIAAVLNDQAWRVTRFKARGPLFQVDAHAELKPYGAYQHSVHVEWQVSPSKLAPARGKFTLQGNLDKTRADLTVASPYNAQARATVRDLLDSLALKAHVQLNDTRLQAIRPDLPQVTVSAQIGVEGTLNKLDFNAAITATHPKKGTAKLDLIGWYGGSKLHIKKLALASPDSKGHLLAHGDIALAAGRHMDLVLQWRDLQWPLKGEPTVASPRGRFTVSGPLSDYRVNGGLRWWVTNQQRKGRLELKGRGSLKAFQLQKLTVTGAPGRLTGHARIVWAPRLDATVALSGNSLNPGAIITGWPGDFELGLKLTATQKDSHLYAQVRRLHVDGTLRGQPLHLEANAKYGPDEVVIEQLDLRAGQTTLQVSGQVSEPMDVQFSLASDDLSTTIPDAEGRLTASGHVGGRYKRPEIKATLEAHDLAYRTNQIGRLELNADIDWQAHQHSTLQLVAENGSLGGIKLNKATVQASGAPGDHQFALDADTDQGNVALSLTGDLDQKRGVWTFVLSQASLAYRNLPPWQLAGTAQGKVTATGQRLEQTCFRSKDARLCLQGAHDVNASRARFSLKNFDLAYLQPLMPDDLVLQGGISAQGHAQLPSDGAPTAQLRITTSGARLAAVNRNGKTINVLSFKPGNIRAKLAAEGSVQAHVQLPLTNGGGIQLDTIVHSGNAPLAQRPWRGELTLNLGSIGFLAELVPEITQAKGHVKGHYRFDGTLSAPKIDGRLVLDAARLGLATPGLTIHDLSVALIGAGSNIDIRASARSGKGDLNVRGHVTFGETDPLVKVEVSGQSFLILDNRMGRAFISPDLTVKVTDKRIDVTGKLHIPKAMITPQELPVGNGAVTVADDQVIVRPGEAGISREAVAGRKVHARIRLIVGDPTLHVSEFAKSGRNYADTVRRMPDELVQFEGFGLKAVIVGNLLIMQQPTESATASGELRIVVGQYQAYGQDLRISDSSILFAGGPITKPALDIRAVRRPREDILVGVHVTGTLEHPKLTIFSQPSSMTQAEQLSWLILGRPLSDTSNSESSMIARASLALGVAGGNKVGEYLSNELGVDHIGLESNNSGTGRQVSLVLGKYLTPKLYVSYGIGLFKPVNTLRLRYTLSKLWHLETQTSGMATGGDLIFSIELP